MKTNSLEKPLDNQMKERVVKLKQGAHPRYDDPVHELASAEDKHRQALREMGVEEKHIPLLADIYSTQELEKMELKKDSLFDSMTGIYNRNTFDNLAWKLVNIEKREGKDCSFLLIDFDHFKEVNDTYGHPAGDEALKQLAETIKNTVRESDVLFRAGGEEFVAFLPDTDLVTAKNVAEKIRRAVEDRTIDIEDKDGQKLQLKKTITIGCAGISRSDHKDGHGEEFDKALVEKTYQSADRALYEGKTGSRNRVVVYGEKEAAQPRYDQAA